MIVRVVRQPGVSPSWEALAHDWARQLLASGTRYRVSVPVSGVRMEFLCWPERDEAHVFISGGGGGLYQFIGTGPTALKTYPAGAGRYLPLVYAVLVEAKDGALSARPLTTSVEAPPGDEWHHDPDPRNTDQKLFASPAHQWDGNGVRQHFFVDAQHPKRDAPWMMAQWQQSHPLQGFGAESGEIDFYTQDTGYDFAPTLFEELAPNAGRTLAPISDWYQSAAFLEASERRFVVMVDADNVFYCYPTSGYVPTLQPGQNPAIGQKGNVPPQFVKSQPCPWPGDVAASLTPIGHGSPVSASALRPLWSFAPDGTKAACVAAVREAQWGNSAIHDNAGIELHAIREDYPVLVEVSFAVSVTGPDADDFTFEVSRTLTVDSRLVHGAPVAVGYAVRPMSDGQIEIGDLLMLEYRHYTNLLEMSRFSRIQDGVTLNWPERPNKATVAAVVARKGGSWIDVDSWLAYYGCFPHDILGATGPYGPREFSPLIEDFPGVPPNEPGKLPYWNHFSYIAQHFSIDLASLSFGVTATLNTIGTQPPASTPTVDRVTYGAEAQTVIVKAFGEEKIRKSIGHPLLQAQTSALFDLETAYPDIGAMTPFSLGATIDFANFDSAPFAVGTKTNYATLEANNGLGTTKTAVIEKSTERVNGWQPIKNCGLFPGAVNIWAPRVYSFWDGWPNVRPGIVWADSTGVPTGSVDFTGYRFGAVHHRAVAICSMLPLNDVHQRINVHRNGSWAVFAGPFVALRGLVRASEEIPNDFEQAAIDRIAIKKKDKDRALETTHVAMLASAFDKDWSEADYFFEFRRQPEEVLPEYRVKATDPTPHDWYPVNALSCMSPGATLQYMVGSIATVRVISDYSQGLDFVKRKPYASYSPFLTTPTPCLEGLFPFPGA